MNPWNRLRESRFALIVVALALAHPSIAAAAERSAPRTAHSEPVTVHHRTTAIDGVDVFYREAGPVNAPTIVLLHGFPTSSNMFRNLIPVLATRYRVIAPDYPGFGHSETPPRGQFAYSFANYAEIVGKLLAQVGAKRYAMYVMDYGAPVGYRVALEHPERVTAFVIQNGNAYAEGLQEFWEPIKAYWASGAQAQRNVLRAGLTLEATREQYLLGTNDATRVDPTTWVLDQALLDRPGVAEIQLDLFYDYRTNVELYPRIHEFFRTRRPPALIVWGKHDKIFPAAGANAYLRDLPNAELHLLDAGHFALEDHGPQIATLMLDFLGRHLQ